MKSIIPLFLMIMFLMTSSTFHTPFTMMTDQQRLDKLNEISKIDDIEGRVFAIFHLFLDTPYDPKGPLGECGDDEDCSNLKDSDTRYGLTEEHQGIGEDCVTLRDKVLALALASDPQLTEYRQSKSLSIIDLAKYFMDDIRYQRGKPISYDSRNHYEIKDFLPQHEGRYVISDNLEIAPQTVTATCKPRELLGVDLDAQVVSTTYIPRDSIPTILPKIPQGAIILVIRNLHIGEKLDDGTYEKGSVIVSHVGICIRKEGEVFFGHASSTAKKVVLADFVDYFNQQTKVLGIKVLRLNSVDPYWFVNFKGSGRN